MTKKLVYVVLGIQVLVLAVALAVLVANKPEVEGPLYDNGALIDATGSIVTEEEADAADLAYMLVALADGENMSDEQVNQIEQLLAGLFCSVQMNDYQIERIKIRLYRAEASLSAKEGG